MKNHFVSLSVVLLFGLLAAGTSENGGSKSGTGSSRPASGKTGSRDEAARSELMRTAWVRDAHVSPGHMNVGVLRGEKDWRAAMIGKWVCGVLAKHGSQLTWVRFVDIEAVVNEGRSPNQAEISKHRCT